MLNMIVNARSVLPKYQNKNVEQYMRLMKQFDYIQEELVRPICAVDTKHCCIDSARTNDVPDRLLELQHEEAVANGWNFGESPDCMYLNNDGCTLQYTKSPQCAGMLCSGIEQALLENYETETAQKFIDLSVSIRRGSLKYNPADLFRNMEEAIKIGSTLVVEKQQNN